MLEKGIALLDIDVKSQSEILSIMANELFNKGLVKEKYKDAVIAREKEYPTGLQTPTIGIAIPHTDSKYVYESQIAVARLKNPVHFLQMGDEQSVSAKLIFMLALKEAHSQLEVLQKLVALIQDEKQVEQLLSLSDSNKVLQVLIDYGL